MKNVNENDIRKAFEKMTSKVKGENVISAVKQHIELGENQKQRPFSLRTVAVVACAVVLFCMGIYAVNRLINIIPNDNGYYTDWQLSQVQISDSIYNDLWKYCVNSEENKGKPIFEFGLKFESWQEAQQYLGIQILKSDEFCKIPENVTEGGEITLVTYADSLMSELQMITISSNHLLSDGNTGISVLLSIPLTEKAAENSGVMNYKGGELTSDGQFISGGKADTQTYEYTSGQNGIYTQMAVNEEVLKQGDYSYTKTTAQAYFVHGGIGYTLSTQNITNNDETEDTSKAESTVENLKNVIDSMY